ncbi:MAG: helix-turn-helix transcriptional regulator [Planktotalea sp.]|uniref:helix-turn-helix domain-containing protein n=1 Tax=Planktotalea sp. TaxID=2029877 RepID=UPI00261925D7|nr:helix-turn-helix transcriptional regulator [Planktotalea sp.]MDG1085842.1 helix-turn-helix transcriptional regulator [Planktotalea sp.]
MPAEDWYGPDAATFGDRLAAAREYAQMSQALMARRLGIRASTLRSWEQDLSEPRANHLSIMAGVLNVSMMWLMNGEGEGLDAPNADAAETDADVATILRDMRDLRVTISQSSEQLGRLEKRLRAALKDT